MSISLDKRTGHFIARTSGLKRKSKTFATRKEAKFWLAKQLVDKELIKTGFPLLVQNYKDNFLVNHPFLHKIRKAQVNFWEKNLPAEPRVKDILDALNRLDHRKDSTKNVYLLTLNHIFVVGSQFELTTENPVSRINSSLRPVIQKPHQRKPRFLYQSEIQRLLLSTKDDLILDAAIKLALTTGMRLGEIQALDWMDINGDCVFIKNSKAGTCRTTYLQPVAKVALDRLELPHLDRVFKKSLSHALRYHCSVHNIIGISWHRFRHSFATYGADGGSSLFDLQRALGHSDISTTMRYVSHVRNTVANVGANAVKGIFPPCNDQGVGEIVEPAAVREGVSGP